MLAEKILRKHVAVIHAYSMMSALQRKIVNILLYEAIHSKDIKSSENSVAVECVMPLAKLVKSIYFNSNNKQYLKEAIDSLASLKIEWNLLKDKSPVGISFLNLRILHGSPTFYENGTFNFSFHKVMLELVGNPAIYGTINVDIQAQFESKYSHSLYENSTRFVNLQKEKIIQLDIFRKILGVDNNKYQDMRELTRNVIKPSLEEVNDRANFVVNIQNIKTGKKVVGLQISVENKNKLSQEHKQTVTAHEDRLFSTIKQFCGSVSISVLESVIKNYSEDYILEKIAYTKRHAKVDDCGFYPVAYFISALRDDYKYNKPLIEKSISQKKSDDNDVVWREKFKMLQSDLKHWQLQLEYAKILKNTDLIENIVKVTEQCQKKLKEHLSEEPIHDLISEAD